MIAILCIFLEIYPDCFSFFILKSFFSCKTRLGLPVEICIRHFFLFKNIPKPKPKSLTQRVCKEVCLEKLVYLETR